MSGGGWGPALRIAWRTARHHRGRTALVAVLVALPVLVGGFLDVVARTAQLPAEERVRRFMGTADAYVAFAGSCGPITGVVYYDHRPSSVEGGGCFDERQVAVPDLQSLLPPGSVAVSRYPTASLYQRRVTHGDQSARLELHESDISSPLVDGIYHLVDGRLPATRSEVLAPQDTLDRLDAAIGDDVTVNDGPTVTIVGRYVDPAWLGSTAIMGPPGWLGAVVDRSESGPYAGGGGALLVDLPDGADPVALQSQLLTEGVILAPRAHVLDPPEHQVARSAGGVDFQAVSLVMLVVGFGLLEVVLLAGTAFAVSARRQVRDLGLVAATGGEARHVRRIVLAQGVVIGFVGAAVAIPLAIAAVFFGRPWLEPANGALMGPLDVRPAELSALVLIGLLSGLAAALVPAFTAARLPVLDALNKRFKSVSLRTRWPRIALATLVTGVATAADGAGLWRNAQLAYDREVERYQSAFRAAAAAAPGEEPIVSLSHPAAAPGGSPFMAVMLLGFTLAAIALAIGAPVIVATFARLGRKLPLSGRLALRDAGRHRHRTGPAVAAIMAAVAGSVGLAFYTLSDDVKQDKEYFWSLQMGQALVEYAFDPSVESFDEDRFLHAVDRASEALPATALLPVRVAEGGPDPEHWSSAYAKELPASDCRPAAAGGESGPFEDYYGNPQVGVDDGSILAVTGDASDAARAALRDGNVVVTDCHYIKDGEATIAMGDASGERTMAVPAVHIPREPLGNFPAVLVGNETAESLDLPVRLSAVVIDTDQVPTRDEEDDAQEILDRELDDGAAYLRVERGHQSQNSVVFLALVGGSAFVTLAGTAIAVALAAAESRADHATLLAVGAEPRRRRFLAMGQAATVSVLGVGLGVMLGTIVGASILGGNEALPFVVPWMTLAQIAVGIPLVGVLIAGLFTRSRLPLDRRMG